MGRRRHVATAAAATPLRRRVGCVVSTRAETRVASFVRATGAGGEVCNAPLVCCWLQYGLPGERAGDLLRRVHVPTADDLQRLLRLVQLVSRRYILQSESVSETFGAKLQAKTCLFRALSLSFSGVLARRAKRMQPHHTLNI